MTEKVLPYDRAIVKQETGYWCGPASVQVVLNSRGINASEQDLAYKLGTTVNGTNHIGLIADVLRARLPDANYRTVQMPNDPPTEAQRNALWANIVRSVDAGYGAVVNIVAPPSNYPRGVNGSSSPRYGGGIVYHYMTAMGYNTDTRSVWIADSGFDPYGYWISLDQLATLIPPKGYCYADVAPAPAPVQDSIWRLILEQLIGPLKAR